MGLWGIPSHWLVSLETDRSVTSGACAFPDDHQKQLTFVLLMQLRCYEELI